MACPRSKWAETSAAIWDHERLPIGNDARPVPFEPAGLTFLEEAVTFWTGPSDSMEYVATAPDAVSHAATDTSDYIVQIPSLCADGQPSLPYSAGMSDTSNDALPQPTVRSFPRGSSPEFAPTESSRSSKGVLRAASLPSLRRSLTLQQPAARSLPRGSSPEFAPTESSQSSAGVLRAASLPSSRRSLTLQQPAAPRLPQGCLPEFASTESSQSSAGVLRAASSPSSRRSPTFQQPTVRIFQRVFSPDSASTESSRSSAGVLRAASLASSRLSLSFLVVRFIERRRCEVASLHIAIFKVGLRLVGLAVFSATLATLAQAEPHASFLPDHLLAVLGHFFASAGMAVVSLTDAALFDIDGILEQRRWSRLIVCLFGVAGFVANALLNGTPISLLSASLVLIASHKVFASVFKIHVTTIIQHMVALNIFSDVITWARIECLFDGSGGVMGEGLTCLAADVIGIVGFICIEGHWFWSLCRPEPVNSDAGAVRHARSLRLCCFMYLALRGMEFAYAGFIACTNLSDCAARGGRCVDSWLVACAVVCPLAFRLTLGDARLLKMACCVREDGYARQQRDAAFVAHLLDSTYLCAGEEWWRFRGSEKNVAYSEEDVRHHFDRGVVLSVGVESFCVKYPTSRKGAKDIECVPTAGRSTPSDELLAKAIEQLRCMEWKDLTLELLQSGPICGSTDELLAENRFLALSRPLRIGETIDFFVSHSWKDDPYAKHRALSRVVDEFQRREGRVPTFWFDKVCLDQSRIADGLRVLPLTISACNQLLMLFGPSYAHRLWCMWELFTILALDAPGEKLDNAKHKIKAVALEAFQDVAPGDEDYDFYGPLCEFEVAKAKCFDPNDELRLRKVIRSLGEEFPLLVPPRPRFKQELSQEPLLYVLRDMVAGTRPLTSCCTATSYCASLSESIHPLPPCCA